MNNEVRVLVYLREKKKAMSITDISSYLKLDSFIVEEIIDKLKKELKVVDKNDKVIATDYHTGILNIQGTKGYIDYNGNKIWISQNKLNDAIEGDVVLVNITNNSKGILDGEVVKIITKHKKNNVGTVVYQSNALFIKADREDVLIPVFDLAVGAKVLYEKGSLIKDNIYEGYVKSIIGHKDDPNSDILSILSTYGVSLDFNDEVRKEVESLATKVSSEELIGRKDLRGRLIFTIDGADTKDIDDAISLEKLDNGYRLGVHIADVSHYVKVDSPLDKEAYKRGTSIYPPGSVIPMLPHELSSGICSLFENNLRLTLTCEMVYDFKGNLLSYEIYPSFICSAKKMTYSEVNDVLKGIDVSGYKLFKDNLKMMNEFKDILKTKRVSEGSIEFDIPKAKVVLDDLGRPKDIYEDIRGDAEKLIEEFMLAANTCVASDLSRYGDSIYRVHEEPDITRFNDALRTLKSLGVKVPNKASFKPYYVQKLLKNVSLSKYSSIGNEMILKSMSKAIYSKDNYGHYGLGFKKYTHFTSPIRRYPDLTVHRLIKKYHGFEEVNLPYDMKTYLSYVSAISSFQEKNADICEGVITRMKMAEYISSTDEIYPSSIISVNGSIKVKLFNGIIGTLEVNDVYKVTDTTVFTKTKLYKLGDTLEVKAISSSKSTGEIRFIEKTKKLS